VCVTAGKSSSGDNDLSAYHSRCNKLSSWSSLFRCKSNGRDTSSLHGEQSIPVHAAVSQPFKPVGLSLPGAVSHNPSNTTLDSSSRVSDNSASQTVSSECPLLPSCTVSPIVSSKSPQRSVSLEHPLLTDHTSLDSSEQVLWKYVSSEQPLPSMYNLSDDSGSEEDPTIESKHRSDTRHCLADSEDVPSDCCQTLVTVTSEAKLSAATRISMALPKPDLLLKSQSDPDIGPRNISMRNCNLAPTTKISMAVSAQTSKIGRRLSTMLHNSRLRQRSSSAGIDHRTLYLSRFICCLFLK